jgi:hypothetical protein
MVAALLGSQKLTLSEWEPYIKSMGACDFLQRKFASLDFLFVLLALIGLSDFYFQKVTRTQIN